MENLSQRLNKYEAIELLKTNNLLLLGQIADLKRQELHSDKNVVTFVVDRNINYTNICTCKCKFCSFYKEQNSHEGYVLDYSEIKKKIDELIFQEGTQILLQGGLNSDITLDYYLNLISNIRRDFPTLTIHAFSPPEIAFIAKNNQLPAEKLLKMLVECGLSSIPGGGAEMLTDKTRSRISPNKISSQEWLNVMEIAHNIGLYTTATMVFGLEESQEEIIEHLFKIRELQDRTGKFRAFIPWSFKIKGEECISGYDYLKVLAISRLVLDNIPNIQVSWVTQGLKVAQLGLRFGGNDFGGTMLEENVVRAAGIENKTNAQEVITYINKAGFIAAQRDTAYNIIKTFDNKGE